MSLERLQNYLGAALPLVLSGQQCVRLLRTVFALVFASAVAVHLLAERGIDPIGVAIHALTIALVYTIAVGLAVAAMRAIYAAHQAVHVWQVWAASLACLLIGYYLLPVDDWLTSLPGLAGGAHLHPLRLVQLLPVWFVLTYIFVHPYMHEALRLELARLQDINRLLEQHQSQSVQPTSTTVRFSGGRTDFELATDAIRNVVVEDHYCYIHFRDNGGFSKRDLAMPLRDIRALLPVDGFAQVHRSHLVNLAYAQSIQRQNRQIRLVLSGDFEVPVSRHRLAEVLPRIKAHLG